MDENGTLDLSMKKNRKQEKVPLTSSGPTGPTPSSSPFKTGSILVNATCFYQTLCEKEGWNTPINYSKTQGRKEEDKEVFVFSSLMYGGKNTTPLLCRGKQAEF